MLVGDLNQEQLFPKASKRARHYGAAKQYARSRIAVKKVPSTENLPPILREDYYGAVPQSSDPLSPDPTLQGEDEVYHVYNQKSKTRAKKTGGQQCPPPLFKLGADELERVAYYLDTKSAINLLCTCKEINQRLTGCSGFWHQLCKNENFHEYSALKLDEQTPATKNTRVISNDDVDTLSSEVECEVEPPDVKAEREKFATFKDIVPMGKGIKSRLNQIAEINHGQIKKSERLCWSGERFHNVQVPENATLWHKIYLRGMQMRRNICEGRFELWRLFLTDENHLPVKKMTSNTTFRELRYVGTSMLLHYSLRNVIIKFYFYLHLLKKGLENAHFFLLQIRTPWQHLQST